MRHLLETYKGLFYKISAMPRTKRNAHEGTKTATDEATQKKAKRNETTEDKGKMSTGEKPDYRFWLMKSEPESRFENGVDVKFGIEDLKQEPDQTACWDGVRNYQARNFMQAMKAGQKAFFYHSNTKPPGIVGVVQIVRESYVDHTQFDKKDPHYDSKASEDKPKWFMVDVKYERMTKRYIPLQELKELHLEHKATGGALRNLALFTRARLSVMPISDEEWEFITSLEETDS